MNEDFMEKVRVNLLWETFSKSKSTFKLTGYQLRSFSVWCKCKANTISSAKARTTLSLGLIFCVILRWRYKVWASALSFRRMMLTYPQYSL